MGWKVSREGGRRADTGKGREESGYRERREESGYRKGREDSGYRGGRR
jgi:hypothetical protein